MFPSPGIVDDPPWTQRCPTTTNSAQRHYRQRLATGRSPPPCPLHPTTPIRLNGHSRINGHTICPSVARTSTDAHPCRLLIFIFLHSQRVRTRDPSACSLHPARQQTPPFKLFLFLFFTLPTSVRPHTRLWHLHAFCVQRVPARNPFAYSLHPAYPHTQPIRPLQPTWL